MSEELNINGDYAYDDDEVFDGITLKEFVEDLMTTSYIDRDEITEVKSGYNRDQIVVIAGHEYIVMRTEGDAEDLATEQVRNDLENDPEMFDQSWLRACMSARLNDESFLDYAAENAIGTDGWPHFLSRYDGCYETTTKHDMVIWREN